jgi:hypothetical protein
MLELERLYDLVMTIFSLTSNKTTKIHCSVSNYTNFNAQTIPRFYWKTTFQSNVFY